MYNGRPNGFERLNEQMNKIMNIDNFDPYFGRE